MRVVRRTPRQKEEYSDPILEKVKEFYHAKACPWPEDTSPTKDTKVYSFRVDLLYDEEIPVENLHLYLIEAIRYYHAATSFRVNGSKLKDYRVFTTKQTGGR